MCEILKKMCVAGLLILTAFGCATVDNQAFNRAANKHIKTIIVLTPPALQEYSINILHHPGMSFGLIGGLIAAAEMSAKEKDFAASIKDQTFDVAKEFADALRREILAKSEGRGVVVVNVDRTRQSFFSDYARLPGDGDAYLDVVTEIVGYWANSHTTPYYPTMKVPVRLVDAKNKLVIYNGVIMYGPWSGPQGATKLTPSQDYAVHNFEALKSSPAKSIEGLRTAIDAVAKQVAADL